MFVMRGLVSSIYMETHCHATENMEKVKIAMSNLIPVALRNKIKFLYERLEGYYGNPIIIIRLKIDDGQIASEILKYIAGLMSDEDKEKIERTLHLRFNNSGNFYMRVDKQYAFKGIIKIADHDDIIKLKIHLRTRKRKISEIREILKNLNLLI